MSTYSIRHLFDASAEIANKQRLRYAIACTLASSIAGILLRFLQFDEHILLFFVVSGGVAVYYSYGNSLLSQTAMILSGSLIIAIAAFFSILIAPYIVWALLYFAIVSFLAFYYSSLNTGWLLIAKLGLVILSFTITQTTHNTFSEAWLLAGGIFAGGIIAVVVNSFIYLIAVKKPWKYLWQQWHKALEKTLKTLSNKALHCSADNLLVILIKNKSQLFVTHPKMTLLIERITYGLVKFSGFVRNHSYVLDQFEDIFQQFYCAASKAIKAKDTNPIQAAFNQYRTHMMNLSKEGFFKALPISIRKEYAECFFLIEKLNDDLTEYIKNNLQQTNTDENFGTPRSDWSALKKSFKRHKIFTAKKELTNFSKVAIRGGVTLSLTFLITYLLTMKYAAWVMLSTALVLQVRQGDTIKKALDRIGGHLVGAFFTLAIGYFVWTHFWSPLFWVPVLIFFGSYYFLKNYFIFAAVLMPIIVYLYATFAPTGFTAFPYGPFVFTRFIDVAIGSLLAMMGGILIFRHVGIKPFSKASSLIFQSYAQYIRLLKFSEEKHNQVKLANNEKKLLQQLEENQQLYQSLSFQPECYIRNKKRNKELINLQARIYENISALSRRVYLAGDSLSDKQLVEKVNFFLDLLSENLSCNDENSKRTAPKYRSSILLELEKSIEQTFSRYDQQEFDLKQLLYFLSIVNGVKSTQNLINSLYLSKAIS